MKKFKQLNKSELNNINGGGLSWEGFGEALGNIASAADDAGYMRAHKFTYRLKRHHS